MEVPHTEAQAVFSGSCTFAPLTLVRKHARRPRFIDENRLGDIVPKVPTRNLLEAFIRPGGFRAAQASAASGG